MTTEELSMLTPEQKNARIAEACGWKLSPNDPGYGYTEANPYHRGLPNYCRDLNAMHEAEKVILDPGSPIVWANHGERGEIKRAYQAHLERLATIGGTSAICATSTQRADAFLLTV